MTKKILISLTVIGVVAAIAIGGTIAYFSDTETSVGNTFTAGTINISLNPKGGQAVETVSGDLDLKPSQTGWTRSVVTNVGTNPAEIWKHIGDVENREHGIVEPEQEYYDEHPNSVNWKLSNWIHYDMLVYQPFAKEILTLDENSGSPTVTVTRTVEGDKMIWDIELEDQETADQFCAYGHTEFGLVIGDTNNQAKFQVGTGQMFGAGSLPIYQECDGGPNPTYGCWAGGSGPTITLPNGIVITGSTEGGYPNVPGYGGRKFHVEIPLSMLPECGYWAVSVYGGQNYGHCKSGYQQYPVDWVTWSSQGPYAVLGLEGTIITEDEGFMLTGENGVKSHWIYLGVLDPEEFMCVIQSYHLDANVDNWGQSDRVFFDMDFMAQQTTPLPDEPNNVLDGYGRSGHPG